jgi:S1-C subfamily serine protease
VTGQRGGAERRDGHGSPVTRAEEEAAALDAYSSIVVDVAQQLLPSVASLRLHTAASAGRRRLAGMGSAVAVTPDGYLVTSAHVVAQSDGGVATFSDGNEARFAVTGADALSDLAVIRIGGEVSAARLGDADGLRIGQLVIAVGNPLGFDGSVSAGVVSALGRSLTTRVGPHSRLVENVIQTDAALHPGNSGGALADSTGSVVGVSTAVVGPGIGQGLGLAVPINAATKAIVAALMRDGRVRRAYLGIAGGSRPVAPRAAAATGYSTGVEVVSVAPGSPAALAGVRPEDVIVAVEGMAVTGVGDLQRLMTDDCIGREVPLDLIRGGQLRRLAVCPAELAAA